MRTVLNFVVGFALVAALLSSWLGPKALAWYVTPGINSANAICRCEDVTAALGRLVFTQMVAISVGAILGLVAGVAFNAMRKKKSGGAPPPAAAAA